LPFTDLQTPLARPAVAREPGAFDTQFDSRGKAAEVRDFRRAAPHRSPVQIV
jgi:hypothetical protein